jgi:hypothetical protein
MISLCRTAILTLHRARRFARIVDEGFCRQQLAGARNCSATGIKWGIPVCCTIPHWDIAPYHLGRAASANLFSLSNNYLEAYEIKIGCEVFLFL